jgi:probable HAF family extracellular repeat protein
MMLQTINLKTIVEVSMSYFPALTSFKRLVISRVLIASFLAFTSVAQASAYNFATLDVPGASINAAYGINDNGQVVGRFDVGGRPQGFLYSGGSYTTLAVPDAIATYPQGINNGGQVVGAFQYEAGNPHGFLYNGSTYITIDPPNAESTWIYDINNNGQMVGAFLDATDWQSFVYDGDAYSALAVPADGINGSGQMVGAIGNHGLVYNGGTYTTLDHPNASVINGTRATGINDNGQVVGFFWSSDDYPYNTHGFVYNDSTYKTLDAPNATSTTAQDINDSGQVVGLYVDAGGNTHGFIATPSSVPLPATAWLFISTFAGWRLLRSQT